MDANKKIIPLQGMRKLIGDRMKHSLDTNAQLTHSVEADMSSAEALRKKYKAEGKKLSYNDIILKAAVQALTEFPQMNSEITSDGIWEKESVNLGIAVALDEGLIVPNIKDAQNMSLGEIAAAASDLASRARSGQLRASEYRRGSFTVSNLGMVGIDYFTAIINEPEAGILAVGRIKKTPVVVDDEICIRPMATLTLSYDHRITDGEPAARFLVRIRELLENAGELDK